MSLWSRYSKAADDNDYAVAQGGAKEGWSGKQVNDWGRTVMAQLRQHVERQEWIFPLADLDVARVAVSIPTHAVAIGRDTDTRLRLTGIGAAQVAIAGTYFAAGRRCRIFGTPNVDATIVSVADATPDYTITFEAINGNSGVLPNPITDIALYMVDPTESNAGGSILFSGAGTTAERNAKFPSISNASNMLLWFNTEFDRLEIAVSGSWRTGLEAVLLSSSLDPAAAAAQRLAAALQTPQFDVTESNLLRTKITHDGTDLYVTLLDPDEVTVLAEYRFGADAQFAVDDQAGGGFSSATGVRLYARKTDNQTITGTDDDTQITALSIPGANGVRKYRLTVQAYVGNDIADCRVYVGANGNLSGGAGEIVASIASAKITAGSPNDSVLSFSGLEITPAVGAKIGLAWREIGTNNNVVRGVTGTDSDSSHYITLLELQEVTPSA